MKSIFFTGQFLIILTFSALSQEQKVLSSAGGSHQNAHIQVDWTMGEIAVTSVENASVLVSQGFLQPVLYISAVKELSPELGLVRVFPNPATDYVSLLFELKQVSDISLELLDMSGKPLMHKSDRMDRGEIRLAVHDLPEGIYLMQVRMKDQISPFIYKIVKTH